MNHVLDLTLPQFVSWCELASWRGWLVLVRRRKSRRTRRRAVSIPFPDGVFEMPIVLMIYGDAQMFFSLLMLLM